VSLAHNDRQKDNDFRTVQPLHQRTVMMSATLAERDGARLGAVLLVAGLALGCSGQIGMPTGSGPGEDAGERPGTPGPDGIPEWGCTEPAVGPAPLRRLSHRGYVNTLADLFGAVDLEPEALAADPTLHGFDNIASQLVVSPLLAEQYMDVAETLAAGHAEGLLAEHGCGSGEAGCIRGLVADFGGRVFRRPLRDDEVTTYHEVYLEGATDGGPAAGVELAVTRMLQSPHFLYRVESLDDGLDGYELATRLSYTLWGTMPDDALLAAAASGELEEAEGLERQARRLLMDERARGTVAAFHERWLGLDRIETLEKDEHVYPGADGALFASMRTETERFLDDAFWRGPGFRERLFVGDYTFVDERLAAHYGIEAPAGGDFQEVPLDGVERTGLLTQASVLSLLAKPYESAPVARGAFVRKVMLCQELPEPPANVDITPPDVDPNLTTRQRFEQHRDDPACAGCHQLLDPIGFGFEGYDGVGAFRDTENGLPVDDSGRLEGTDVDGDFEGVVGLSERLSRSRVVSSCMALSWFRFAYGREPTAQDACTLQRLDDALVDSDHDMPALLLELTKTDAFLGRVEGDR
jgi:hypothetical protein